MISPEQALGWVDSVEYFVYKVPGYPKIGYIIQIKNKTYGNFIIINHNIADKEKSYEQHLSPLESITHPDLHQEKLAYTFSRTFRVRFVRYEGGAISAGSGLKTFNLISHSSNYVIGGNDFFEPSNYYAFFTSRKIWRNIPFTANFQGILPSCPTPMVSGGNTRTLTPVRWDELPTIGSVAKHQDVNLQFNNCVNLSKIRYRIDASGTSPNAGLGLLPLIAPSTAQGLAIQVLERRQSDNAWVTSALGQWREHNASGDSHTLPMGIRYYRTGNLVGGNVNAAMTISFQYQ